MRTSIFYTKKAFADLLRYYLTRYAFAEGDQFEQMRSRLNLEETRQSPLLKWQSSRKRMDSALWKEGKAAN